MAEGEADAEGRRKGKAEKSVQRLEPLSSNIVIRVPFLVARGAAGLC